MRGTPGLRSQSGCYPGTPPMPSRRVDTTWVRRRISLATAGRIGRAQRTLHTRNGAGLAAPPRWQALHLRQPAPTDPMGYCGMAVRETADEDRR
jgi:hypothetical protein